MKLVLRCPICSQGLALNRLRPAGQIICPSCRAPIRVQTPPLPEGKILEILAAGKTLDTSGLP